MESVTDCFYRELILKNYPDWDVLSCDFLRIPSTGIYPRKHILKHFGDSHYQNPIIRKKTIYQLLASPQSYIQETLEELEEMNFSWVDLNLGCPSKTVCKRQGGSYLLSNLVQLERMIKTMRSSFTKFLTVKMRVGFQDDKNFERCLKIFEDNGIEAITIHGRTREQLYKGKANWDYIKKAVNLVKVPVIGNGDINSYEDAQRIFDYTNCHSIMIGRGALGSPWLAKNIREKKDLQKEEIQQEREYFFQSYKKLLKHYNQNESLILRRFKGFARYMFGQDESDLKKRGLLLRSSNLNEFMLNL